jgi:endonuclease/exonuclease/phosphatase family metal-dependent hydrolase
MRLVTINTWGTRGDWEVRRRLFQDGFADLDADVITLQETVLTEHVDQVAELLGAGYYLAQQADRESGRAGAPTGQGITTASKWPFGRILEVDLHLTERTADFACTCLITEIIGPEPYGRVWVANHFPDYQLDHERERCLQAVAVASTLERLLGEAPGHVIVAGDLDADADSDSIRFWTGRHVIDEVSVCYRSAWAATHPAEPLVTYTPQNPHQATPDWPFRGIDHVLVRCGPEGPTLLTRHCQRVFDQGTTTPSDHYGIVADLEVPVSRQ